MSSESGYIPESLVVVLRQQLGVDVAELLAKAFGVLRTRLSELLERVLVHGRLPIAEESERVVIPLRDRAPVVLLELL